MVNYRDKKGYISFKGAIMTSCPRCFLQENVRWSPLWRLRCIEMYPTICPSSEILVLQLFISYFSLTYSSLFSCERPSANCLFVFCSFFSSSYGTFNYYISLLSVFVLFFLFFLILFLLLSFIVLCNPGNSLHFATFPDKCVCVCVCVCAFCVRTCCGLLFLVARGNVRRRLSIEQKCFNGIGLSALSLTGCFERSKISLDVVEASWKQSCSKCCYTVIACLLCLLDDDMLFEVMV